mmetsp:Transcript_77698/g.204008  ORF Transcript_77698/g.204008 Transcript_77698/m.204008 type:complete len:202 (+) Transcript_77698:849-1454(+)
MFSPWVALAKFTPTTSVPSAFSSGPPLEPGEIGAVDWMQMFMSTSSLPAMLPLEIFKASWPRGKPSATTSSPMETTLCERVSASSWMFALARAFLNSSGFRSTRSARSNFGQTDTTSASHACSPNSSSCSLTFLASLMTCSFVTNSGYGSACTTKPLPRPTPSVPGMNGWSQSKFDDTAWILTTLLLRWSKPFGWKAAWIA